MFYFMAVIVVRQRLFLVVNDGWSTILGIDKHVVDTIEVYSKTHRYTQVWCCKNQIHTTKLWIW